jgi:multiple sugar transport system permease protein
MDMQSDIRLGSSVAEVALPARRAAAARPSREGNTTFLLFIAPYFTFWLLFLAAPVLYGFWISFHEWDIVGTPSWVGIRNYTEALTTPEFWQYARNTITFGLISVPTLTVLGLAFALLVNQRKAKTMTTIARLAFFAPYVVMVTAMGTLWRWILDTNFGVLNYYLGMVGFGRIGWLSDKNIAMLSVVIATTWWLVGYGMVIFIAALQDIPEELYEAGKLDGAGSTDLFWHITLPAVRPAAVFVIISSMVGALRVFGQPYQLTGGGPQGSTQSLVMYIYLQGFQFFQLGYASAVAYLLFVVTLIFTIVQLRLLRRPI